MSRVDFPVLRGRDDSAPRATPLNSTGDQRRLRPVHDQPTTKGGGYRSGKLNGDSGLHREATGSSRV